MGEQLCTGYSSRGVVALRGAAIARARACVIKHTPPSARNPRVRLLRFHPETREARISRSLYPSGAYIVAADQPPLRRSLSLPSRTHRRRLPRSAYRRSSSSSSSGRTPVYRTHSRRSSVCSHARARVRRRTRTEKERERQRRAAATAAHSQMPAERATTNTLRERASEISRRRRRRRLGLL